MKILLKVASQVKMWLKCINFVIKFNYDLNHQKFIKINFIVTFLSRHNFWSFPLEETANKLQNHLPNYRYFILTFDIKRRQKSTWKKLRFCFETWQRRRTFDRSGVASFLSLFHLKQNVEKNLWKLKINSDFIPSQISTEFHHAKESWGGEEKNWCVSGRFCESNGEIVAFPRKKITWKTINFHAN